jgi:3-methyladenine DNA glycosylase AlkD
MNTIAANMTTESILQELEWLGTAQTRKTLARHGAPANLLGVSVADMKKIVKRVKKNHALSLSLYASGNPDAQYLAGLIADEKKISKAELQFWVENSTWYMVSEYTVPWIAAESPYGWELGLEWIESDKESIAIAGWNALSSWLSLQPDAAIDFDKVSALLDRIGATIHSSQNRVRYCMNSFVIAVGSYYLPLLDKAKETASAYGIVKVNLGDTACKVPYAPEYIQKVETMGRVGQKRKMARC